MDTHIKIQKDIKQFLDKMGFFLLNPPSIQEKDQHFFVNIFIDNPKQVIGYRGEGLYALQHLFRVFSASQYGEEIIIEIDINGYKKKRESFIREKAFFARRKCLAQKEQIPLPPMSAYERRIIHSTLVSFSDIKTISTGTGKNRYVVVHPANIQSV